MGRPRGTRNADYETRRRELAFRIFQCILEDTHTSLNAMAERTGVSRPTLRHYFRDRDGAIRAALEEAARVGRPTIETLREPAFDSPVDSIRDALRRIIASWRRLSIGNIHVVGLKIGLEDAQTGNTYLSHILEPQLQAFEGLLSALTETGSLAPHSLRIGALSLLSPVLVALLHQDGLGGEQIRALEIDDLIDKLAEGYCRQHAPALAVGG